MKRWFLVHILLLLPLLANAQFKNAEMTISYEDRHEILVPEEGNLPPDTDVSSRVVFGRLRLQDMRQFPLLEASYEYDENFGASNLIDARFAGLLPLIPKKLFVKALYLHQNPDDLTPKDNWGAYLYGMMGKLNFAAGLDYVNTETNDDKLYSLRAKYRLSIVDFMAGVSSQPNDQERYTAGGLIDLPAQFQLGGLVGVWEDATGWCANFGRFNQRGDFDGLPSFALNYLEVPLTYKWTNFRIMWGDAGIHYVKPTFDNSVFSGMLDLDVALMLKELMPDNYRHFDSPLLFKRYDEYGKVAFRVNYIETETDFRRLDANISANPGLDLGALKGNRLTLTYDRMHNPAFGWQDTRYHLTAATYLFGKVYSGVTYSSDFDEYRNLIVEFRLHSSL